MRGYRYTYKASKRTQDWLVAQYALLDQERAQLLQAAVMFYVFAGWETYYPYPDMPQWLKPRWWYEP